MKRIITKVAVETLSCMLIVCAGYQLKLLQSDLSTKPARAIEQSKPTLGQQEAMEELLGNQRNGRGIIDDAVKRQARGDPVDEIDLSCSNVMDAELRFLKGLENLRHLNLGSAQAISDQGLCSLTKADCVAEEMKNPKRLRRIVILDLRATHITDEGLCTIGRSPWPLRTLFLGGTKITDKGLFYLKQAKLTKLDLSGTQITDAGLAHLSRMESLEELDLDSLNITDKGLSYLSGLHSLRWLEMFNTRITDAGLTHLLNNRSLTHLDVSYTGVTIQGKERFLAQVKNLANR